MDSLNKTSTVVNTKGSDHAAASGKQNFYNPYQHRDVKHPTSWVYMKNYLPYT